MEDMQRKLHQAMLGILDDIQMIVEIDLQQDTYVILYDNLSSGLREKLPQTGRHSELNLMLEEMVGEEYLPQRTNYFSIENLVKTLQDEKRMQFDYKLAYGTNVWRRDVVQATEYRDGKPVKAFFYHMIIEDAEAIQVQKDMAIVQAKQLSDQAYELKQGLINRIRKGLQTSLDAIIGSATIARAYSTDSDRVEQCLQEIIEDTKEMHQMMREIVSVDSLEKQDIALNNTGFYVEDIWNRIIEGVQPLIRAHRHKMQMKIEHLTHTHILGDEEKIEQIFYALIQNAISYTPNGGRIDITINEIPQGQGYSTYEFSITDNGVGMSEKFCKEMFQPFSRELSTQLGRIPGCGLGLVIVNNLVRLMDGELKVESRLGAGTTIVVRLKLPYVEQEEQHYDTVVWKVDFSKLYEGRHILLVEDSEWIAVAEKTLLEEFGVQVEVAGNAAEAIHMIEQREAGYYDMIFMDLTLPGLDGYAATVGIRRLNRTDCRKIPIIAMRARSFSDKACEEQTEVWTTCIPKPIKGEMVADIFKQYFG